MATKKQWTSEELSKKIVTVKQMDPSEEQQIYNKLIKTRVSIIIGFPFFGFLSAHLEFVQDYTILTAATDGMKFYYNPYYIKALDLPYVAWLIVHEIMHCCLDHIHRRGSRDPQKWNYACDYVVHSIMMQYINHYDSISRQRNALRMPQNCLYNSKYDNMSAEQVYSLLPKNYATEPMFGNSSSKSNSGNSKNNDDNNPGQTPLDDHSRWDSKEAQQDASIKARTWVGRMMAANLQAASKDPGHMPGSLSRLIDKISKPQRNWRQILMDYLQKEINDFSWQIPDNRYTEELFGDIKLPSFNEAEDVAKDIVFAIDVSGSMSDKDVSMVYSEIVGASQLMKLHGMLLFWDTRTTDIINFDDVTDLLQLKKDSSKILQNFAGGTDPTCVFDKLKKDNILHNLSALVFLSDGYFHFPAQKIAENVPVIWCIVNQDDSVKIPWGKEVRLDPYENDK